MAELQNFSKAANACDYLNIQSNVSPEIGNLEKPSPSTQSFDTRFMNIAWTICYGTTIIILLFLLFLWYYFEKRGGEYDKLD